MGLDLLAEEGFLPGVEAKGRLMRERLERIVAAHPEHEWAVRGRGMMQALDTGDGAFAAAVQQSASSTAC